MPTNNNIHNATNDDNSNSSQRNDQVQSNNDQQTQSIDGSANNKQDTSRALKRPSGLANIDVKAAQRANDKFLENIKIALALRANLQNPGNQSQTSKGIYAGVAIIDRETGATKPFTPGEHLYAKPSQPAQEQATQNNTNNQAQTVNRNNTFSISYATNAAARTQQNTQRRAETKTGVDNLERKNSEEDNRTKVLHQQAVFGNDLTF